MREVARPSGGSEGEIPRSLSFLPQGRPRAARRPEPATAAFGRAAQRRPYGDMQGSPQKPTKNPPVAAPSTALPCCLGQRGADVNSRHVAAWTPLRGLGKSPHDLSPVGAATGRPPAGIGGVSSPTICLCKKPRSPAPPPSDEGGGPPIGRVGRRDTAQFEFILQRPRQCAPPQGFGSAFSQWFRYSCTSRMYTWPCWLRMVFLRVM